MRKFLLIVLVIVLSINYLEAQVIAATDFKQKGNSLIINYKLSGLSKKHFAEVELFVSTDGGTTFKGPLKAVSGDVGIVRTNGKKNIRWNVFDEFNALEGVVVFDVRAKVSLEVEEKETFIGYTASGTSALGGNLW